MSPTDLTRRQVLRNAAGAGAALGVASLGLPWLEEALAASVKPGRLGDIEHVIIFMQENRSFDHYFGRYPGVRGFGDKLNRQAFTQGSYPAGTTGTIQPWHIDAESLGGDCTHDITHDWGPQHRAWNQGAMNHFVAEHLNSDGADQGSLTMGYYDQADVPLYWALAKAFTLCDRYHCSVIGPTDPNRLMSMSGTLDPDGKAGGPHLSTLVTQRASKAGAYTWPTYPEALEAKGISWKVYTDPQGGIFDNVLPYFANFQSGKLKSKGIDPKYPDDFLSDISAGTLPQVSWVLSNIQESEHPEFSGPLSGQVVARDVLEAVMKKSSLWKKTALFLTWDENGGFFDHVPPPVAPAGTPGEYVTVNPLPDDAQGINGPLGLGFRVPMLVVSPFSRGGFVSSNVFDHTSTLRFCETRFGVKVPNLSAWRRAHTGDLTAAFNFVKPNNKLPALPAVSLSSSPGPHNNCFDKTPVNPPTTTGLPKQLPGKPKRPHGLKGQRKH